MTSEVTLRPGLATLADWRNIYRGAPVVLDSVARADIEAGSSALSAILAKGTPLPVQKYGGGGPSVVALLQKGEHLPVPLVRLIAALKLASLGQGVSGVRWEIVRTLADCLAKDLLPAIPVHNASGGLALSHIYGLLSGTAEVISEGARQSAFKALRTAGLAPLTLSSRERSALLSGTEVSTAFALAGLFEAERVFQSALVASALSAAAIGNAVAMLHRRVYRLHRHPGQIEVAAALRALLGKAASATNEGTAEAEFRSGEMQMGSCLDLLRQAGAILEREANAVSDDLLVLWQSDEVAAGIEDMSAVAHACHLTGDAIEEMARLGSERVAMLPGADTSPTNGEAGGKTPRAMAESFVSEVAQRSGDDGADHISAGARRLLPMAGTAALVVAVELRIAGKIFEGRAPGLNGRPIAKLHELLRDKVQIGEPGHFIPTDLAALAELVRSGALVDAPAVPLPALITPPLARPARRLGARRERK